MKTAPLIFRYDAGRSGVQFRLPTFFPLQVNALKMEGGIYSALLISVHPAFDVFDKSLQWH